ncbi:MAG: hypothetical protein GTN86_06730 [Xanthomonadales bacterium]|nr:hypothetical protein [Xanthomonadales bacterium]NIN60584.1 hypothetical protein [Xanthomonadales bacterium]NIN75936.1 hypothetical protein [Xanthomonadales bacterium]NIO15028.1 hypothetical protein [Xanthomonadales bacterium]NIP12977.1 hypothetical protein [Xanthomonadales bacterium]
MLAGCGLLPVVAVAQQPVAALAASDRAWVSTGGAIPEQCLSAVLVLEIDGREVTGPAAEFDLAPGRHALNGRARVNTTHCPVARDDRELTVPDLEADFEAGLTYHVALDHSATDRAEWALVIWKIEPRPGEWPEAPR